MFAGDVRAFEAAHDTVDGKPTNDEEQQQPVIVVNTTFERAGRFIEHCASKFGGPGRSGLGRSVRGSVTVVTNESISGQGA